MTTSAFVRKISAYHAHEGRGYLPWRATTNPYYILLSEIMLQQTQVERVLPKYTAFLKKFPTVEALARAPLPSVLREWQGLGYNRRGKFLRDAAQIIVQKHGGKIPRNPVLIETLPGVGPYSARAIATFAFNRPEVFIETNIRTVFTHEYFPRRRKVSDKELLLYIEKSLAEAQRQDLSPRVWYGALMDYGTHLKSRGIRINRKSTHYRAQAKFKGSSRELRGLILRTLLHSSCSLAALSKKAQRSKKETLQGLLRLSQEGLVVSKGALFSIASRR